MIQPLIRPRLQWTTNDDDVNTGALNEQDDEQAEATETIVDNEGDQIEHEKVARGDQTGSVSEEGDDVNEGEEIEPDDSCPEGEQDPPILITFDIDRYEHPLRQLGLYEVVDRQMEDGFVRFDETTRGWIDAIEEYWTLLNSQNPEESVRLQRVLDLYPLHKRVLGLVEYIILPRLEAKGLTGNASGVWTQAFTGETDNNNGRQRRPGLCGITWPLWPDKLATLETEGNWLLHAADHATAGGTGPIDLAALLDGIVTRMSAATEVTGVSVSLQWPTPQVHARQLAALADRGSDNAACMTLYLGKVVLMLRNAVEHGTDRVVREGLLLETPGYWTEERGPRNNRVPVFDWLRATATQVSWRSRSSLPATLPSAAKAFLLTPASLQRCLVLLSVVMRAAFSQLVL